MAKHAHKIQAPGYDLGKGDGIAPSAIREAEPGRVKTREKSPAQTLQDNLLERLQANEVISHWPPVFRISFVLMAIAASWVVILLPLALR